MNKLMSLCHNFLNLVPIYQVNPRGKKTTSEKKYEDNYVIKSQDLR